jgi:hypothetical protein
MSENLLDKRTEHLSDRYKIIFKQMSEYVGIYVIKWAAITRSKSIHIQYIFIV